MDNNAASEATGSVITQCKRKIIKKCPKDAPEEMLDEYSSWSVTEKKKLLYAIKKYGWRNTDKLLATVQTKSKDQIERFLTKKQKIWKRLAQVHFTGNVAPVEVWLERAQRRSVRKPYYARSLSTAFSLIGQCEVFPTPRSPYDPNYPELYEYLAQLLRGNTPIALCEGNRRVLLKLLEIVASMLKSSSWFEEGKFFTQFSETEPSSSKDEARSEKQTDNCSTPAANLRVSPVAQMECDDSNSQQSGIKVKEEHVDEAVAGPSSHSELNNNPSSYSHLEDLKQYLFSDDPELGTFNPFNLPFDMCKQASEKLQQLVEEI